MIFRRQNIIFPFLVWGCFWLNAQQPKDLEGLVYSKDGDVVGIHVMNLTTQRATITDVNGYFSIPVHFNDTLVFSAVQFKRKEIIINLELLKSKSVNIFLEEGEIKLDEVMVMPYNLTGDLTKDLDSLGIGSLVSATSLKLPNADVKPPTQSQRKLYTARTWDAHFYIIAAGTKLDPLINYLSGRTKMLKKRVARDAAYKDIQRSRNFYADSLFTQGLGIPKNSINDFMFFCEVDTAFQTIVDSQDIFGIWEFMRNKSEIYRKNNELE
ncbi:MAG: carboxypeptidase-like regulatory domain-containing protein [Maribacter sp.]